MRIVKVGIIGFGRSGRDIHTATLLKMPQKFEIAAVADILIDRLGEIKKEAGCAIYEDYRDLLKDGNVELAVVATPTFAHKTVAIEAMRAGKVVSIEKPIAPSVAEADEILSAMKTLGGKVSIFQNQRFSDELLEIKKITDAGKIGEVYLIKRSGHSFQRRDDWQAMRKFGGGIINNKGVHLLDQTLYFTGFDIERTFSDAKLLVAAGDAEDYGKIVVKGKNITIDMEITGAGAISPLPGWVVFGTCGALTSNGTEIRVRRCDPRKLGRLPRMEEIPPFSNYTYPKEQIDWIEETIKIPKGEHDSLHMYYEAAYEWIVHDKPVPVAPETTRVVLDVLERSRRENGF